MDAGKPVVQDLPIRPGFGQGWMRHLVDSIDRRLRNRYGVREFTSDPNCIFRVQIVRAGVDLTLSDGTRIRADDRVIDLHLWNEQLPPMDQSGPTLGWARRMNGALDLSLRHLAGWLDRRRDLADIVAIRANMKFGAQTQSDQLANISARFGFERVVAPKARLTAGESLHRFGDSLLISMMTLARNAAAFRFSKIWRDCTLVYLSRRALLRRYRPGGDPCDRTRAAAQ
jgi:hypothetical protein